MKKVFLSHAQADKVLVDKFETLLEQGIGLAHDEIFCTSLAGLGIPPGVDFKEYIRQEISNSEIVIALISSNYYASSFCMCELGAAWVLAKDFFPILVDPIDFKDLRGALKGMQCTKLSDRSSVSALYDRLHPIVKSKISVERWETRKDLFYEELTQTLARIKPPESISPLIYGEVKKNLEACRAEKINLLKELDQTKQELIDTRNALSPEERATIRKKYSTESQQYIDLINKCSRTLKNLPPIVRMAFYFDHRGENFIPREEDLDAADEARQDKLLKSGGESEYALIPDDDRPSVQAAKGALLELREFLEEASPDFINDEKEEHGDVPDLSRKSYWKEMDFF